LKNEYRIASHLTVVSVSFFLSCLLLATSLRAEPTPMPPSNAEQVSQDPTTRIISKPSAVRAIMQQRIMGANQSHAGEVNSFGDPKSPVKIVVFQDLGCGACKFFYQENFSKLKNNYIDTGKVHLTFMEFPLLFQAEGLALAEAAKCAGGQGKYLAVVDLLHEHRGHEFNFAIFAPIAEKIGLDISAFEKCVQDERYRPAIRIDSDLGKLFGVEGTPTIFINGKNIGGASDWKDFKPLVEHALRLAKTHK